MKTIIISCALAAPLLAIDMQAAPATVGWRGNPLYPMWNVATNWSPARVPTVSATGAGDKAAFNSSAQPPAVVNSFVLPAQFVVGDNNPGLIYIANGGTLTSSNYDGVNSWNAIGYNNLARVEVLPGGSLISSNHLWVALHTNSNARAQLVLNGGTATVQGMIGIGWNGGIGTVQVNGGTLNLWQWNDTASISPLSQLDIRNGSVIISNDHSGSIASYIAGGQITGFGGVGTVNCSVVTDNVSNTNTVLTASCPPGAGGPYPVTNGSPYVVETTFPTNINPNLTVHYWALDPPATPPNANWTPCLNLVTGGDQATVDVSYRGLSGKKANYGTTGCFNIYDEQFPAWNTNGLIDVLLCVYGDGNVLRAGDPNQPRRLTFEEGTLPVNVKVYGGFFSTNIYNAQWNWVLFTITNNFQTNMVDRLVGSVPSYATGSTNYGGINGGTIRIAASSSSDGGVYNMSIRAIAFGQHGAFGTGPDVNQFVPPDGSCPPVLDVNEVGIDFNAGYTNYLQVINDPATGQEVTYAENVGPAGDQRKAVIPTGSALNFGILSNYLGKPCNDNAVIKVCVDYYDDPAFAGMGVLFGPQAYASDSMGDIVYVSSTELAVLQGSGKWIRQSWTLPSVNLVGVYTAPLTGGPQFISAYGQVAVSRIYMAALRTSGPLAGQDPLADCAPDPNVCFGVYKNYAELDLANGITNGVDLASNNSGDQTYVVEQAGPANDKRWSVAPSAPTAYYLNFQIVTNSLPDSLGPVVQGNVYLTMMVTYYDDPALAGQGFRPDAWTMQQLGSVGMNHMSSTRNIILQGTDKWRDAYWEIGSISFNGVNQHPAAARFSCGGPVHISRIRYAVIRSCGPTAGQNLLSNPVMLSVAPDTNSLVRISWPYRAPQAFLQSTPILGGSWGTFPGNPVVEGGEQSVLRFVPNTNSQFFRLDLMPQ